jgi:hypothetical protein
LGKKQKESQEEQNQTQEILIACHPILLASSFLKRKCLPMKISVSLDNRCIQTAIKRQHERLVAAYLKAPPRGREKISLEKEIEGLTYLLENGDFAHMRAKFPILSGKGDITVFLLIPEAFEDTRLLADGAIFPMKWKKRYKDLPGIDPAFPARRNS